MRMVVGLCILFAQLLFVTGLFEDQIGKYDWRQQYLGKLKHVFWDQSFNVGKRLIVSTEKHLVASLHSHNGSIAWRKVFEEDGRGIIDDVSHSHHGLVTLGGGGRFVRAWHAGSGAVLWENPTYNSSEAGPGGAVRILSRDEVVVLSPDNLFKFNLINGKEKWRLPLSNRNRLTYTNILVKDSTIYVIGRETNSQVTVMVVDKEGTLLKQHSVPAAWLSLDTNCEVLGAGVFVCVEKDTSSLQSLNLIDGKVFLPQLIKDLGMPAGSGPFELAPAGIHSVKDIGNYLVLKQMTDTPHTVILNYVNNRLQVYRDFPKVSATFMTSSDEDELILLTAKKLNTKELSITGYNMETGAEIGEITQTVPFPDHHGLPVKLDAMIFKKKDGRLGFKFLIQSQDMALKLVQKTGRVSWTREESLATILAVEMMDLPVSENQAKFEDEFGERKDFVSMFANRFKIQFSQLKTFLMHQLHKLQSHKHHNVLDTITGDDEEDEMTRDEFNLNKIIIAATSAGKIFGIKSSTGEVQWQIFLKNLVPFHVAGRERMLLFTLRTTAHFPHPANCVLLGKDGGTGNGIVLAFSPITGDVDKNTPGKYGLSLGYPVMQAYLLGEMDEHFQKGIVLLDKNLQFHVYPESYTNIVKQHANSVFSFVVDVDSGFINGYRTIVKNKKLFAEKVWNVNLQKKQQTITNVVAKRLTEHVHSQGRVLGDRSVLYKYINPNLVVVTAEGEEAVSMATTKGQGYFVNIYLIDAVTGHIVFHANHKRAKGPVRVVHSENWVVYDYINLKSRRHEIAVLELFEGKQQSNSTAFSSLSAPWEPLVLRQSYIIPVHISTMAVTITEKGITSKSLLLAMTAGKLLMLPKAYLDPRRPLEPSQETMEEGTIPYIPEIPVSTEAMINYNQSVECITGIYTASAGLESTSMIFAYGLDLFFTQVTPSKMFDVLKEDFDFYFISLVLLGMFAVTFVTQKLASRKALSRAWK